jgi:hypothetical protein
MFAFQKLVEISCWNCLSIEKEAYQMLLPDLRMVRKSNLVTYLQNELRDCREAKRTLIGTGLHGRVAKGALEWMEVFENILIGKRIESFILSCVKKWTKGEGEWSFLSANESTRAVLFASSYKILETRTEFETRRETLFFVTLESTWCRLTLLAHVDIVKAACRHLLVT